jgi:site-specific DNA-methyltransferase (adenine-specific)
LDSTFQGSESARSGDLSIYQKGGVGYVPRTQVEGGSHLVDAWKIFVGFAAPGTGNKDTYPHKVISTPFVAAPGSVSTETYLCIGPFGSKAEADNALSYLSCRLTRFLIQLHKASQNTTRKVYTFVPTQDWAKPWTDADLYERYGISDDEVAFIEKIVRPMDISTSGDDSED